MRVRYLRLIALLSTVCLSLGCGAPRAQRLQNVDALLADASQWRMERLDLDVRINAQSGGLELSGEAVLRLDGDASPGPTLSMNSREPAMGFTRLEGTPAGTASLNDYVERMPAGRAARYTLAQPARRGDRVTLRFGCAKYASSFQLRVAGDSSFASWVEGWYPSPPSKSEGAAARMSAVGRTRLHLPAGWHAASNGRLVERRETSAGVEVEWVVETAVARSFAAAPYTVAQHRVGGRDVGVYLLTGKPDAARQQAESLGAALAAIERRIGGYPYASYAIAEIPLSAAEWYAASEQGFIMARSDAFEFGENLPLFAHEMAHGWWGNLVNAQGPGSILCTESLAQYMAVLAIEGIEGPAEATKFLQYSRKGYNPAQCAKGYFAMARRGDDAALAALDEQPFAHNLSDAKGHWFYHMARHRLGDDLFFGVLRGLVRDFAGKAMSLDDVRRALTAAAPPTADMPRFLADWLDRPGAPLIELEWKLLDRTGAGTATSASGSCDVEVVLRQTQKGTAYSLDIELAAVSEAGEERRVVRMADSELRIGWTLPHRPEKILLDPDCRLLIWRAEYGEPPK